MSTTYRTIRGTTMTGGFEDDQGASRMHVAASGGAVYSYDPINNRIEDYEPTLCIDPDGLIIRRNARPGYGFLPDSGELDRLTQLGIVIPSTSP